MSGQSPAGPCVKAAVCAFSVTPLRVAIGGDSASLRDLGWGFWEHPGWK